jgi:GTP:adenosylcobinamide-phosphate guanylyltransferase
MLRYGTNKKHTTLRRIAVFQIILVAVIIKCIIIKNPPLFVGDIFTPKEQEDKWENFGAYYKLDETVLFLKYNALTNEFISRFISNVKIRILTPNGAKYGTVTIPKYLDTITDMKASMTNAQGATVPLDVAAMKKNYLEKGKVVFPQVTAGCELNLSIEFTTHLFQTCYDYWFVREIPVRIGRFSIRADNLCTYDCKSYGDSKLIKEQIDAGHGLNKTWTVEYLETVKDQAYADWPDISQPRVAVAMRGSYLNFVDDQKFCTWKDWTEYYNKHYHGGSNLLFGSRVNAITDKVVQNIADTLERVRKITEWVQKNISCVNSGFGSVNINSAIKKGRGNARDVTYACNEMLHRAGISSDILYTRPHSQGGFDSSFVSADQLYVPLIITKIYGRAYTIYPLSPAAAVGEYPEEYFGLCGLNIVNGKITPIPPSVSQIWETNIHTVIDLSMDGARQHDSIEYRSLAAYALRSELIAKNDNEKKEYFRMRLKKNGNDNELVSYSIMHLEDNGAPLIICLNLKTTTGPVPIKTATYYKLTNFFDDYLKEADTSRNEPFFLPHEVHIMEDVVIKEISGKTITADIKCADIQSSLMDVRCGKNNGNYSYAREINIHSVRFPKDSLVTHFPEVKKLNGIRESSIIIE